MNDGSPIIPESEIDIQPLILKLGHHVEEIRVRALQSILFKLDHDLICISDVIHKKDFLIKLLEWFNFESCSQQKDVLQLLEKLSKHSSGLETLVNLGAVDFLSRLRRDVDPSLYHIIDDVLTNLTSLPDVVDCDDEQLQYNQEKQTTALEVEINSVEFVREEKVGFIREGIEDGGQEYLVAVPIDSQPNSTAYDLHAKEGGASKTQVQSSNWRFPWISLAESDRHVLATTNTRLQSNNATLAKKSCEFLSDVLFKDFPAEIFMQRPSIVKTLLTLLEVQPAENHDLALSAVSCLSALCSHLKHRYLIMTDPQWYSLHPDCWKNWLGTSSVSSSAVVSPISEMSDLRTTGDGGERSSESSKSAPVDGYDEEASGLVREALELNQMSVDEFCLQVLCGCCPLLCNDPQPLVVLTTLQAALNLLQVCYPHREWWQHHKLKSLRKDICDFAAKSINYHMRRCGLQPSDNIVEHNITSHAMTVVNTALWLIEFYGPMINSDMDNEDTDEDLCNALRALITNEILFTALPEVRASLEHCPVLINDDVFFQVYCKALTVKESFLTSVEFLKEVQSKKEATRQDKLTQKLDSCLIGLPYHRHHRLITHAISFISEVFQRTTIQSETNSRLKNILLSLLSSGDPIVRRMSYQCCCEVLKKALKHSLVTNPMSRHWTRALFMIDSNVIYVVCAFGLADSDIEIVQEATSIIETLLDGRLNMDSKMWRKLLNDLVISLPFLQTYLDQRSKLSTCLLGLLAPPGESPCSLTAEGEIIPISQFEQLRAWLRCMFQKDKSLRAKGYGYLIQHWMQQDVKSKREMVYPSGGLENSCDLFIVETFAASARLHRPNRHANFSEDRIRKLFDIVVMETNELSLRKSSAEQLAVLMQDPTWHDVLLEENADDSLVKILHECLYKEGKAHISSIVNPKLELAPPTLKIVRLLSEFNVRCRHKLAQDSAVYDILSRHAMLAPAGGTVRYEVSCLMTLLLFDEIAQCPSSEESREYEEDIKFALPALFLKRYSLPFSPPLYKLHSPYQRDQVTEGEDALRSEPIAFMLRVAWNLAWRQGSDGLPQVSTEIEDGVSKELRWTSLDSKLLTSCSAKMAVTQAISSIIKATSHYAVRSSVGRLTMHFLAENCLNHEGESTVDASRQVFFSCDWQTAFERYFTVFPKSPDDDRLLSDVLKMFRHLITHSYSVPPDGFMSWLAHVIMRPDSAITLLLHVREEPGDSAQVESKRLLRKDLLEFLTKFLQELRGVRKPWFWSGEVVYAGDFTRSLTLNLSLNDSPQYYDLPTLESTLQCLLEVSAIPGFSTVSKLIEPNQLCMDTVASLLQILTAFNAGRLGAATSFMGRGVTMSVSLSLVNLAHEVSAVLKVEDWPSLFQSVAENESEADFPWLSTMWSDHLAEVRWSGLSIANHILQHTRSPLCIKQNFAGGLWNLALIILLDNKECCLVRDQAAALFSTLLTCLRKSDESQKIESGLMVQIDHDVLNDVPALHLLLSHHKFYSSFHQILRNVVIQNTPRLPGTATFTESLSTTSSNCGILYQSLDTDSQRSSDRTSTETTALTTSSSSAHTGDSGKRLLRESPETLSMTGSTGYSTRSSSAIPLISSCRVAGDIIRNENHSTASPVSVDSLEIVTWVTPRFVGTLSRLLTNLVQVSSESVLEKLKGEEVLGLFVSHLDSKYAVFLISQLRTAKTMTSQQRHLKMNLIDSFNMYRHVCVLLVTCSARDPLVAHALQQNSDILERMMLLLHIDCSSLDSSIQTCCQQMWNSVVVLLLLLVKTVNENSLLETPLEEKLFKYWSVFAAAFKDVLLASDVMIRTNFLHFLAHLLLREGKRTISENGANFKLRCLLDANEGSEDDVSTVENQRLSSKEGVQFQGSGSDLVRILLTAYEENETTKDTNFVEKRTCVVLALRNLLCVSVKAKETSIEAGFLTKSLEKIKKLHFQLNMESIEVVKPTGTGKKEMDLLNEIVRTLELVKNLLFRSNKAKLAALDAGIVAVLQPLWSWCTVVKTICLPVLELLCTLTARCPQASIAMSNTSSGIGSSIRLGPSNNTFVHCIVKMASKVCGKLLNGSSGHGNLASCQMLFSLLKNMAMTSECRGIMWKSNFTAEFSRLKTVCRQKWKASQKTAISLWLELLANVSFYRDGQQMVAKLENIVQLLLEFCGSNSKRINEAALLVLRNLCFHVPSKTLLLSNTEVVQLLLKNVDKHSLYTRALASSALWALLSNNQKAKSILVKPALVVKRLSDSKLSLESTTQDSGVKVKDEKYKQQFETAIESILKMLRC